MGNKQTNAALTEPPKALDQQVSVKGDVERILRHGNDFRPKAFDIKEPFGHHSNVGFELLKLSRPFVTPKGIVLPLTDKYGWPHGVTYQALLEARTSSHSTRATFRGMKFLRRFEALSLNEQRIMFSLAFHPYVVDIRDQYGIYDITAFWAEMNKEERLRRTDLMTIDVIVTYVLPGSSQLRYHGISIKPAGHVADNADLDRERRESEALAERGWTWELMRGDAVTDREFANNFMMYRTVRDQDVAFNYDEAYWFASILLKSTASGTMDSVLGRVSRRVGISDDAAHQLFTVAVAHGFLTIDHSKELRVDKPLHLIR